MTSRLGLDGDVVVGFIHVVDGKLISFTFFRVAELHAHRKTLPGVVSGVELLIVERPLARLRHCEVALVGDGLLALAFPFAALRHRQAHKVRDVKLRENEDEYHHQFCTLKFQHVWPVVDVRAIVKLVPATMAETTGSAVIVGTTQVGVPGRFPV